MTVITTMTATMKFVLFPVFYDILELHVNNDRKDDDENNNKVGHFPVCDVGSKWGPFNFVI